MRLAVLIPALNEEATIASVISRIPNKISGVTDKKVIVVDDGSNDLTAEVAQKNGAIVIRNAKNLGLGQVFQIGLEKALDLKTEILVNIDADGQFDPVEISLLIKPIIDGEADFVTGSRFVDKDCIPDSMPFMKRWGNSQVARIISWAAGQRFYDVSCGFRAYGFEAMLRMNLFGKFTYTQETFLDLAYKNLRIREVPVRVRYFVGRKSRVANSIFLYAVRISSIIFRTMKDYKPLKFFGFSGIIIFVVGLMIDIFVINHFFRTGSFSPYKVFGFLGAFMNAIGVIIFFMAILADLIDKVRLTQEKILYYEKRRAYFDGP